MNKEKIEQEIGQYELEIRYDYEAPKGVKTEDEFREKSYEVMYISTQNDPSVGIFGEQISPLFKNFEQLSKWWKKNKKRIIKKYT